MSHVEVIIEDMITIHYHAFPQSRVIFLPKVGKLAGDKNIGTH